MKIFLMAYARKNLGDDLFIKMLLERYPNHEFYMKINDTSHLDKLNEYKNLTVLVGHDTDEELYKTHVDEYDAYIYIGGSIFMEGGKVYNLSAKFYDFIKRCKESNKPFCYVSSNYGPYYTEEYLNLSKKAFADCYDICFRDKYSYEMFKDSPKVRYAPDYIFTYPTKTDNKIENSIGISVIDLDIRENLKDKSQEYINMLTNNIRNYLENGMKVYLFSFCKNEGDEKTIDILLDKFSGNENLIDVRYDGDLDSFIDIYSQMEYMICARFHAMILSSTSKQKMYVMSYSKKIDNVIKDLEFNLPILHFDNVNNDTKIDLKDFVKIEDNILEEIIKEAENHELAIKRSLLQ